ncbi:MAG: protease pro-enzyme activation domain-containing protein [Candidatus Binataceae bacterium]
MYRWITSVLLLPLILTISSPVVAAVTSASPVAGIRTAAGSVRLPGHVLPALSEATAISTPSGKSGLAKQDAQPITLTIVLRRDKQSAFDRFLKEIRDPHSKNFRHYLTQRQIADRFGPSREAYDSVLTYLRTKGFHLVEGSSNRLTITVAGTRGDAERAFDVTIGNYQIGKQIFFANQTAPALPQTIASRVLAISGLSSYAKPKPGREALFLAVCSVIASIQAIGTINDPATYRACFLKDLAICFNSQAAASGYSRRLPVPNVCNPPPTPSLSQPGLDLGSAQPKIGLGRPALVSASPWQSVDGSGQTVGLVEFDNFNLSDVSDFLALIGAPESQINNISEVNVGGGASVGPGEDEVLLDIDAVTAVAPGAKVVVYDAPFAGAGSSFQAVFNKMIDDGVSIISNSWAYCENQTTAADVDSIDTIFQNAAASNITIFNGSGDSGSTCLDGSANTVAVPADSPNATAVGGSSLSPGPGFTYGTETWWNDATTTPPAGQGGFGTSKFFAAPSYQKLLTGSSMRMVPDVVANADPFHGVQICQADDGGCPNGKQYGGTSLSAPEWAAYTALLNQGVGQNAGFFNPKLYSLSATAAFHNAASMGSDFTHVGLGSPDLSALYSALTLQSPGAVSASASAVAPYLQNGVQPAGAIGPIGEPDDGTTASLTLVSLYDSNGIPVAGKTVTLTATGSAHISPASGVSDANGNVSFQVTDSTAENVVLTATGDSVALTAQPSLAFVTAPAASAGLDINPNTVPADGVTPADITVTLEDSKGRPSPGKLIQINQSGGNSVITGPIPPVTDSNGTIEFTATDSIDETVTYSAVDVTDGNVPFPQNGTVTFNNSPEPGCAPGTPPAVPGFVVTPYAIGFFAQAYSFGNINFACTGAVGLAFDSSGNLYVSDAPQGNIYKFPPGGGVVGASTLITPTSLGKTLANLVIDASGNLYGSFDATTGNFNTGAVVQIDPSSGTVTRTIASDLTCPSAISIDPLSGDIFADDSCSGAGSDNPALWRISNPDSDTPVVSVYATLPTTPNDNIAFTPSGMMYVWGPGTVAQVSGTNGPPTPTVSTLPGVTVSNLGILALGTQGNGDGQTLFVNTPAVGSSPSAMGTFDLTTNPPTQSVGLVNNGTFNNMIFGPDGCIYAAQPNAVYKITDTSGGCAYTAPTPAPALVLSPTAIAPNPAQGTSQTISATFHYSTVPAGTPVQFIVSGANPQTQQGLTNANQQASFTYIATHQGVDTITAAAALATTTLTSNQAVVTWGPGKDVTFVSLNPSPSTGSVNQSVNLVASLTDVSSSPAAALEGQEISFALGGSSCGGTSNASGIATCAASAGSAGTKTLSASFAGTSQYVASNAAVGFNVIAPAVVTPTPTPTATPTPSGASIEVSPADIVFPPRAGNRGTATRKFRITNVGTSELTGYVTPLSDTAFFVNKNGGYFSLKPGKSREVTVRFKPPQVGNFTSNVLVVSNDPVHRQVSVTLSGIGTPRPKIKSGN